jgi:hypothetical protein
MLSAVGSGNARSAKPLSDAMEVSTSAQPPFAGLS